MGYLHFSSMHPLSDIPSPAAQSYLSRLQCARQWRGFLQALAVEFSGALPNEELRDLMHRIGVKFALQNPLAACETLTALQGAMVSLWSHIDWGVVELAQESACITIRHHCAPLPSAFGADQGDWIYGFLQGAYQQWFDAAGARNLRVGPAMEMDAWGSVKFELSL